ncbi:uncharacterized protein V1510DRAFT_405721 [Dipodascopsis tothii]|uniref:uncharacterized protein n=1 Tax=Dipodascopsis tothii TaxID=44089 RepID=UPI0034CE8037
MANLSLPVSIYKISGVVLITYALLHLLSALFSSGKTTPAGSSAQFSQKYRDTDKLGNAYARDGYKISTPDHFTDFYGAEECKLSSNSLYNPQLAPDGSLAPARPYCKNKADLLAALSGGGRAGFNMPFQPLGCEYRWFDPEEICMILDRFDAIIFVGEQRLTNNIYAAFNSLLRKNVAWGGLRQWELNEQLKRRCRCDAQYTNPQCGGTGSGDHFIVDSTEILDAKEEGQRLGSPYICNRVFHGAVYIKSEPVPSSVLDDIDDIMTTYHKSARPVPVIFQQGLSHGFNWDKTTRVMDTVQTQLEKHEPNPNHRPVLWLGPPAAGHLKPPGAIIEQGHNALWHFSVEMQKRASDRGFDALNLYNLTLQADSYDGTSYGQEVSLTTAMMVINWLSRIETL